MLMSWRNRRAATAHKALGRRRRRRWAAGAFIALACFFSCLGEWMSRRWNVVDGCLFLR